jgi:hypothetical protein
MRAIPSSRQHLQLQAGCFQRTYNQEDAFLKPSLDVFNSAAVHPDAEKTTFGNLRRAQLELKLMTSKWRRMSYNELAIAGGVLERLVSPTGEVFDRDRGWALNLPGFAPLEDESDRAICNRR